MVILKHCGKTCGYTSKNGIYLLRFKKKKKIIYLFILFAHNEVYQAFCPSWASYWGCMPSAHQLQSCAHIIVLSSEKVHWLTRFIWQHCPLSYGATNVMGAGKIQNNLFKKKKKVFFE